MKLLLKVSVLLYAMTAYAAACAFADPLPPAGAQAPPSSMTASATQPEPNPLNLSADQRARLEKISSAAQTALQSIEESPISQSAKVAKIVALTAKTKTDERSELTPKQRSMVADQDKQRADHDPLHTSDAQRAQLMLLNYSLQKRAMAIYENKHTSDRAKVAAMDQLNKEHEAGMNAILTPEQRKTLASLRSLQSKMQSEPAAQR